jgi:Zn-dependent peptidase ImmA (M78 family)
MNAPQALGGKPFDIDDDGPLDELAKKFRVSRQALEYRIRNLPAFR